MNETPLISIIIPVYNTEKYVAEAIESILAQTYKNIEIVCVNDGSTDGSLEVLKSFGSAITIIDSNENVGIAEGRNKAIRVARGEYLALMDADDTWMPEKLELQMNQFDQDPNLDISFTMMQAFISPELADDVKALRQCPPDPMPGYISATALIKTESFLRVGYFDPKWRVGEFIDWFSRVKDAGCTYAMVDKVLFMRRIHATNTGVTQRPSRLDYVRIAREALERKRNQS